ncbi:MAG: hypothetical protein ACYDB0_06955 [Acidithiobacillus sp.]
MTGAPIRRVLATISHPQHLRWTLAIASIVGTWLTFFILGDLIWDGGITPLIAMKMLLNYLTPFLVANLGLLSHHD